MYTILLHSSKTVKSRTDTDGYQPPRLLERSRDLAEYLRHLTQAQLMTSMKLSRPMAAKTHHLISQWSDDPTRQSVAIDTFLGDIYSGLQVATFTTEDRQYANRHLLILSGLYGGLRALDSIMPYRLEMGYRLPDEPYRNLVTFWGDSIAGLVPAGDIIINLSAVEYTDAVLPHLPADTTVVSPRFMTLSPKTGEPAFVTVHAKIARGACAHWLIKQRASPDDLHKFDELGYHFDPATSTPTEPVFVCKEFGGIGLSVRLS